MHPVLRLIEHDGRLRLSVCHNLATAYMDEELQTPFVGGIAAD